MSRHQHRRKPAHDTPARVAQQHSRPGRGSSAARRYGASSSAAHPATRESGPMQGGLSAVGRAAFDGAFDANGLADPSPQPRRTLASYTRMTPGQLPPAERRNEPGYCEGRKDDACYLDPIQRVNRIGELRSNINQVFNTYLFVLRDQDLLDRLKPDPALWMLVVDVFFGAAAAASGGVAGLFKPAVVKTAAQVLPVLLDGEEVDGATVTVPGTTTSVPSNHGKNAATVIKVLTKAAKNQAKAYVKSNASTVGTKEFVDGFVNQLAIEAATIGRDAATAIDDDQLTALVDYYHPKNHPVEALRADIERLCDTYAADVQDLGKNRTVAVLIEGPHGPLQRRLAICRKDLASNPFLGGSETAEGELPSRYVFDHWVYDGYQEMVTERQSQRDRDRAVEGLRAPAVGPKILRSDSPGLRDPDGAIAEWVQASVPRFVPATYGPDGSHDPGGIHVPRIENPVPANDEEAE